MQGSRSLDPADPMRYVRIATSMITKTTKKRGPSLSGILHRCSSLIRRASVVARSGMSRRKSRTIEGGVHWKCPRCKRWKLAAQFGGCKRNWNGLRSSCHKCEAIVQAGRRVGNRELVRRSCRESYQRNKDKIKADQKKYRRKNPEKINAQNAINSAIRSGELARPNLCEMCGRLGYIEAHHDSYDRDRRLVVTWLCRKCHKFLHARRREQTSATEKG